MSEQNILSAAINAFKQNFTEMCHKLPNMFDTLDEKSFAMMTFVLMNASSNAGKAGLEVFLKEHDSVCAKIEKTVLFIGIKEHALMNYSPYSVPFLYNVPCTTMKSMGQLSFSYRYCIR